MTNLMTFCWCQTHENDTKKAVSLDVVCVVENCMSTRRPQFWLLASHWHCARHHAVVIVVDGDCDDAHKTIPLQKTTTNETKIPFGRVNLV